MPKIKPLIRKKPLRVLELFKGTGSVEKAVLADHPDAEIISVDILEKWKPTIVSDILDLDYKQWKPGYFDIIWASPPCTYYSSMQQFRKISPDQKQANIDASNRIVQHTLDIIDYLKPSRWYIENPQTGTLKNQDVVKNLQYCDATYCKYGYPYKKKTRFWTNTPVKLKICSSKDKCQGMIGNRHKNAIGMRKSGNGIKYEELKLTLADRYSIPQDLLKNLLF